MVKQTAVSILLLLTAAPHFSAAQEARDEFSAKLPDGTTIELVGLRNYSILDLQQFKDRNYPWWRPDGTAIVEPPDTFKGRTSSAGSYWFVIRVREGINHDFKAVGPYGIDLTVQPVKRKAQGFEKDDLRHFSLRFSSNQKQADIKLGLATGDWKVMDRWSIEPDWTPYNLELSSSEQLILRCPEQIGSDVVAEVTQVITERATRLVVFDQDGNRYESKGEIGGEGIGLVRHVHRFKNLDKSNIEHIEFQARPYNYWIMFRNVSLEMGHKTPVQIDVRKPGSLLLGQPIPSFDGINIEFADVTKGGMLLICFFDLNQRPSRRCVTQLARQAEQLKQKGVTIVAVQASKLDESKLNDWIKEYNVFFPVGMIQANVEKTRFAWGVHSLPWLILTDKEHIVRADGFALEELDEKIKQAGDSER